jgi:hypothetical protein
MDQKLNSLNNYGFYPSFKKKKSKKVINLETEGIPLHSTIPEDLTKTSQDKEIVIRYPKY